MGSVKCSRRGGSRDGRTTASVCACVGDEACMYFFGRTGEAAGGGDKAGSNTKLFLESQSGFRTGIRWCPDASLSSLDPSRQSETPTGHEEEHGDRQVPGGSEELLDEQAHPNPSTPGKDDKELLPNILWPLRARHAFELRH